MGTHHLILGETSDFITGKTITDTHDERARQKIARFLVEHKGYEKYEIQSHLHLTVEIDGRTGAVPVDFVIKPGGKFFMLIVFRPGSLVSRRRTAVAAARIFAGSAIPYAVVTNAQDAEIIETASGKVIGNGLGAIFSKSDAVSILRDMDSAPPPEGDRLEKEKRILFAMEVLAQKECDDYKCQHI
ncbi:MAG: type I restriction enzyme HsdR N-terminal domain-containing protein [Thermodesulfobacteriota bacterium]